MVEETFTVKEVSEVLRGLQAVVYSEVEFELINTAHTSVLALWQLFSQARSGASNHRQISPKMKTENH